MNLPVLAAMAALVVLDLSARVRFSVTPLYVFLVVWAAWSEGFAYASVLGAILCAVHFAGSWAVGMPQGLEPQLLNTLIRGISFVGLAFVTSRMAWRVHVMRRRILDLEGRLPVCRACGLIREAGGGWVPVDRAGPPEKRPEVMCPDCERKHYDI